MRTSIITAALAQVAGFVCFFVLGIRVALAQGTIVYGAPQAPLVYNAAFAWDNVANVGITGAGASDFTLISSSFGAGSAGIAPQGNNSILATSTGAGGTGPRYIVALPAGAAIGSSLDGTQAWYSRNTDQYGQAVIGFGTETPSFQTTYVGFDLDYDSSHHYGWMRLSNPSPFIAGEILDWAYETSPNTSILAGAVPEPSCVSLMVCLCVVRGLLIKRFWNDKGPAS